MQNLILISQLFIDYLRKIIMLTFLFKDFSFYNLYIFLSNIILLYTIFFTKKICNI